MDFLKKSLMPITDKAWEELVKQSDLILKSQLTARRFADVEGPHGWEFSAIPLGRLDMPEKKSEKGVNYGIRKVQPLVEVRVPFSFDIWELDNIARGAEDADLEPLETAARQVAAFEDRAVYYGLEKAGITGLKSISEYPAQECPKNAENILFAVTEGMSLLKESSVEGPYTLVVNPKKWLEISSASKGYPLKRQLEELLNGQIIFCAHVDEIFLVSGRGGDFKLTLGTDLSIGYEYYDAKTVKLYFTETFTFQALEPRAVVVYA